MADKNIYDHEKQKLFNEIYRDTIENHEGCWLWTKSCFKGKPYGQKSFKNVNWRVHRLMYVVSKGHIPDNLIVRHLCGNSLCCNPLHLETGTYSDNNQDAVVHGTSYFHRINQYGVNNHIAKLTEEMVYDMRRKYAAKEANFTQLGEQYNVNRKAAERAVRGQTYPEFNDVPPIPFKKKEKI